MKHLLALFLCLLAPLMVSAKTVSAAGDPWPPFLDPKQSSKGIVVEIATAAFATQGYDLKMNFVPWARAIDGVKNAKYDVLLGTWWTEERAKFLLFSEPYMENAVKFIKQKGSNFEYNGLSSLNNKSVGVVRGYGYGDEFLNATNFKRPAATAFIANIKKLVAGRIDLTLEDELVARSIIANKAPDLIHKLEFTTNALSRNKLFVTSGLANAKHKELIQAFNKGLKQIKTDGTFDAILKKHNLL